MDERQLIFLISQPRSGSSLTQQLLLNATEIDSSPEPWQMLSLIHTFKVTETYEGYNPNFTVINYLNFLEQTKDGLQQLKNTIKTSALRLYQEHVTPGNRFLDKTPRYYHIIDELYEMFPNAKFIFLVRNPLAVFASILSYNFNGDYVRFLGSKDRIDDLFLAPRYIQESMAVHPNHLLLKYEDLVENTESEMTRLFQYLEIAQPKKTATYELGSSFAQSNALDQKSLSKNSSATTAYLEAWKTSLDTSQKQRLALDYIHRLNQQFDRYFEYDLDAIEKQLKAHKPATRSRFHLGFDKFAKAERDLSLKSIILKRLFLKFQKR